ncbi:bacterioferritin [Azospirillum thiophilum]|uniref:Bacterioferritin n=1 Tax=Azospirillum thiophilum TaxID=528244 RepID=A0AAC8VWW6_9PROT|nr:bacterioferritin [Azospirillum thiophilum]ALG70701.1 bacterioferritin [Azospirillum thiophilum]KJR65632.1 bacterioferritin [Azospirillum thiophilum]
MQGDQGVVDRLNKLLTGELSAADQYLSHARTMEDMGLKALAERISHERTEELEHADKLIRRILFLEGTPDVASRDPLRIGKTVPDMLRNDLTLEYEVVAALKDVIAYCEQVKDYDTRRILLDLLVDTEEDHAHWLEQQLRLIDMLGLQNYLQSGMGGITG